MNVILRNVEQNVNQTMTALEFQPVEQTAYAEKLSAQAMKTAALENTVMQASTVFQLLDLEKNAALTAILFMKELTKTLSAQQDFAMQTTSEN